MPVIGTFPQPPLILRHRVIHGIEQQALHYQQLIHIEPRIRRNPAVQTTLQRRHSLLSQILVHTQILFDDTQKTHRTDRLFTPPLNNPPATRVITLRNKPRNDYGQT